MRDIGEKGEAREVVLPSLADVRLRATSTVFLPYMYVLHPSLPAATQTHNLQVLSYDIIIIFVVEKGRMRGAGE